MSTKPVLFVSCGQHTTYEKKLGQDICALIREIRSDLHPYFAENQSTLEGLSNNILKAVHNCAGLICVMHRRGDIQTPDGRTIVRGSVWIEQEIAIAAFMNHVLGRSVPILFYKQKGVSIEGVRLVLLLNPRLEFTHEAEVLDDLRIVLPTLSVCPFHDYDLDFDLSYRTASRSGGRHDYRLTIDIRNVGTQRVTDFSLRVWFPRAFLNPNTTWGAERQSLSTDSHICLVADEQRAPDGLYRGDQLRNPLTIDYFVNNSLFRNSEAMGSKIVLELYSRSLKKRLEVPIRDFQEF